MKLESIQHLFKENDQIAWVGSGGKSTLIFEIVNQLFNNAVVTTSTHLGIEERSLISDHVDLLYSPLEDVLIQKQNSNSNLLIYKGEVGPNLDKLGSPDDNQQNLISKWCAAHHYPLFIEADGSRKVPVKAPDSHEPAIPSWVNKVCVVVGLRSFGKKINQNNVFRHEIFNHLTDSVEGDDLTLDHLYTYLTNENGGLKNIPRSAERILFIHQADSVELTENLFEFCYNLRTTFDHVILSSFDNNKITIHAHYGKIAGIILAAGESKRFGGLKQLAYWKDKTFIEHVIQNGFESSLNPIFVVLGAFFEQIMPYIKNKPITVLKNPNWKNGQATSVLLGIQSLPENLDGVIFLLVDQPQITSEETKKIIHYFAKTKAKIISYEYEDTYRHPVLFSSAIFSEFSEITGDVGGRQLFKKYPPQKINIKNNYLSFDIDTKSDLKKLKE